ncbi:MAG: TIGR04211 family SH3 domain-containing protein [Thalassotalea sp.]|nr:TIGR04211 family SH3 domain-containing protein [Thalassotalea sp.]
MKNLLKIFCIAIVSFTFSANAQQASENKIGFISDDLFIYFHAGPGTQYRILGSINAGEEVQVISDAEEGYIQIQDAKNRKGWIDAAFLSDKQGLRVVLAELNEELADKSRKISELTDKLSTTSSALISAKKQLTSEQKDKAEISQKFAEASSVLDEQDFEIKKTWFIYGASVLVIGLLLGLIIPKLIPKKSYSSSSWG